MHYQNDLTHNSTTGLSADADSWYLDAASWAGLCYNLDSDKSTEQFYIIPHGDSKVNIKYTTAPVFQEYDYDWKDDGTNSSGYALIGFFAEPYVALGPSNLNNTSALSSGIDAAKIAKLVIDTDDKHSLRVGETLELGSGYSLILSQLDISGTKAYIKLMYNGTEINSGIVNAASDVGGDWIIDLPVLGKSDVQVMRLHVSSIYLGTESGLVDIDSIWLVDFMNPLQAGSDVDATKIANLVIDDDEKHTLNVGETFELGSDYSLIIAQLDGGTKAYIKLMYDGQEVNSSIVNADGVGNEWVLKLPVLGKSDVQVMRLHVASVSGDSSSGLVEIDRIWLVDFMNPLHDESGVDAIKIAKLVIDTDKRYTLKIGNTLEIGSDYSVVFDQVDVDGNKVLLKLMHGNQELHSSIIVVTPGTGGDWIFNSSILGGSQQQVMRLHVKSIFSGTGDPFIEIDGIWMADYLNVIEVRPDVNYGKFIASDIGADRLTYEAAGITLTGDMESEIGRGVILRTEKNFNAKTTAHGSAADNDKFYLLKSTEESEFNEIRSSVFNWDGTINGLSATAPGAGHLTYENFAAFYYDLDSDTQTETLSFNSNSGKIDAEQMRYVTKPAKTNYVHRGWEQEYYVMGFFGETYIPLNFVNDASSLKDTPLKSEKMAKLVIDDDNRYTMKVGSTLEIGEGYSLFIDQVSVNGETTYLKLLKDGKEVAFNEVSIKSSPEGTNGDWILKQTILDENDVQVLRVHVKNLFQGPESSLVEIEGIWLMDYANAKEIKLGDKIGVMKFQSGGDSLVFVNDDSFTITPGMDKPIANHLSLRSSETDSRAYFYVGPVKSDVVQSSFFVTPAGSTDQIESVSMMYASNDTLVPGQEKMAGFDSIMIFSPAAGSSWNLNEEYYFLAKVKSGYTFDGNDFKADSSGLGRTLNFNLTGGSVSKTLTVVKDEIVNDKMVYGTVWNDANQNGIRETSESPISDVTVRLYTGTPGSGTLQKTAVSKADGSYSFSEVAEGNYYIEITLPSDYIVSSAGEGQSVDSTLRSESFNVKADNPVEKNVGLYRSKTTTSSSSGGSGGSGFGSAVISNGTPATSSPNKVESPEKETEKEPEKEQEKESENTQNSPTSPSAPSNPVSPPYERNWVWPAAILSIVVIGGAAVILLYWMKK